MTSRKLETAMFTNDNTNSVIRYIYLCSTIYVSWKLLNKLWTLADHYLLSNFRKPINFNSYGKWAVITGSTDGIGKGFAEELAAKGLDICLISRNEEKLINTAKYIENTYNVKTKYIVADFTNINVYSHIQKNLTDLDIGILVNNVGMIHDGGELFSRHYEKTIKNYVTVNILSVMMMSSIVLPIMFPKKKGLILNISSIAGEIDAPYIAVYAASKPCVTKFGTCLSYELKKRNIEVRTLTPGYVLTNMVRQHPSVENAISQVPYAMPNVKTFVKSAIKSLNSINIKHCGYFSHELFLMITKLIPVSVLMRIEESLYSRKRK